MYTIRDKTKLFNIVGGFSALWLIFFPIFYPLAVTINIIIPLASIYFIYRNPEKVGVNSKKSWAKQTPIPKIDWAILSCSFALILRALFDLQIIGIIRLFIYAFIIVTPIFLIIIFFTKEYNTTLTEIINAFALFLILFFTYGCGTIMLTNALFDNSSPIIYKSKITGKEIEKRKGTDYRIDFEPWGPHNNEDLLRISKEEFDKLNVGDTIELKLREGFYKIKWYTKINKYD